MESLLVPVGVVALAEMGDKTQLLAFVLAARFKKPWPIVWGILLATALNHGLAGALGAWLVDALDADVLRRALGLSFLAMAVWVLIPDKLDASPGAVVTKLGVFSTTLAAFFLAEMGDKTQVATVALAAHYAAPLSVVIGTTVGMLLANVPVVFIGDRLAQKLPMKWLRVIASGIFLAMGLATLLGALSTLS